MFTVTVPKRVKLSAIDALILEFGTRESEGLFTIYKVTKWLADRASIPKYLLRPELLVDALRLSSTLIVHGAIEIMTEMVPLEEGQTDSSASYPRIRFSYVHSKGRLTQDQFERFRPRPKNCRYPCVYRVTKEGKKMTEALKRYKAQHSERKFIENQRFLKAKSAWNIGISKKDNGHNL